MVLRERLRGRGIGSRLLREQLRSVTETNRDCAVALSTQRPENVVLYERLGFRVASDRSIGAGPDALRNRIMTYAPDA